MAQSYLATVAQLLTDRQALMAPIILWRKPRARWRQRAEVAAASRRLDPLDTRRRRLRRELEATGAGSTPGEWGPFSSINDGRWTLEVALDGLFEPEAEELRDEMPLLRAQAVLGDRAAVTAELDRRLSEIVSGEKLITSRSRASVYEFISVTRRPIPESVEDLTRSSDMLYLSVCTYDRWSIDAGPGIWLSDIQAGEVLGHGVGTAALLELCRYADAHNKRIAAEIEHYDDPSDPSFQRLAAWYHRHGFRQGQRPPSEWAPLGKMVRLPKSEP